MIGAREAAKVAFLNPLRNMINRASAQHLHALVVPGPEVALAAGLDLRAAGLALAAGPRQANVLLLLMPLSDKMLAAASVAYAQMPRPRMVLVLGEGRHAPLPEADATAPLTPAGLKQAVGTLRDTMATQGFAAKVEDFTAPSLQSRIQYTCPMHPEIIQGEPGSCPKCGMFLVPKETSATPDPHDHATMAAPETPTTDQAAKYVCPMHPEVTSDTPGNCPECGMFLEEVKDAASESDHAHHNASETQAKYACPMHPEVTSDAPGNCPKCGMNLVESEPAESSHAGGHDHGDGSNLLDGLVGLEPGFMSMIEITDGTPRSSNGLQMEWITIPFGPFFPGLPGGLTLELELDGDTVVSAKTGSLTGPQDLLQNGPLAAAEYVAALGAQMPMATVAYQLLACRAIEAAAKTTPTDDIKTTRSAALAREHITSHLLWLSQLGRQLGLKGIEREAATLHLLVHAAAPEAITALGPRLKRLATKARRTWFLSRRLATVGTLPPDAAWDGPTSADTAAAGRLAARLAEISSSLSEVAKATSLTPPALADIGKASGTGQASVQTARGRASLQVELREGMVDSATLETPSSRHVSLVNPLIEQQELADALVAIASLDLSPWELPA